MGSDLGLPDAVRDWALKRGVHNDCLVAGPEHCCPNCFSIMMSAFDAHYGGSVTAATIMAAILADLAKQREQDSDG